MISKISLSAAIILIISALAGSLGVNRPRGFQIVGALFILGIFSSIVALIAWIWGV